MMSPSTVFSLVINQYRNDKEFSNRLSKIEMHYNKSNFIFILVYTRYMKKKQARKMTIKDVNDLED
jgi:hypothetical protein